MACAIVAVRYLGEPRCLLTGRDLIDEVGSKTDMLDSHHSDRVVEVVDPAGESRRLAINDERERHHPEDASSLREPLELPVGEIPRVVADSAAPRVGHRKGALMFEDVMPGLLRGVRKVEDDAEFPEPANERAALPR